MDGFHTKNKSLIFATNNANKLCEALSIMGDRYTIKNLHDLKILVDIPEPHATLALNAQEKSSFIFNLTKQDCFGEDTGLEIEALNNAPGVKSARYAGEQKDPIANIHKVLNELQGIKNRKAQFKTVISLIYKGQHHLFMGIQNGLIADVPRGSQGFGYDCIFIPEHSTQTYAEMDATTKNKQSHRKKAFTEMIFFLDNYHSSDIHQNLDLHST
ncbi:MAG: RdgB/HAM1 family non-canonical purine NTP pyrophosphatase [Phycisphaerales bacterium]|nr:RdgB/HAM1 family non-canonical purine NTP pyrophosphatase [Phycisphaerales bacterium]